MVRNGLQVLVLRDDKKLVNIQFTPRFNHTGCCSLMVVTVQKQQHTSKCEKLVHFHSQIACHSDFSFVVCKYFLSVSSLQKKNVIHDIKGDKNEYVDGSNGPGKCRRRRTC